MGSQVSVTERAQSIIDDRTRLTQEQQIEAHNPLNLSTSESRYHHYKQLFDHAFTKMCKNADEERELGDTLQGFISTMSQRRRQESGQDQVTRDGLFLPAVAQNTKKNEPRKKQCIEKHSSKKRK
jgi:hypothetical protein